MPDKVGIQAEIDLLTELEGDAEVTQTTLSERVSVSVGLVNTLMKRAIQKGYVKVRTAPYKRYAYYLTPHGFAEKSRLVAEYLDISLSFFRLARDQYGEIFRQAQARGVTRAAFVGCGELAEIAQLSAHSSTLTVDQIIDPSYGRSHFGGLRVVADAADLDPVDALIITDAAEPQKRFDELVGHFAPERIFAPELLRISRRPPRQRGD